MLELRSVSAHYGSIQALNDISLSVSEGEIVCLIGANGAGKSTLLNVISGTVPRKSGAILLDGKSLDGLRPHQIVRHGVVQVPEGRQIFGNLTVAENLEMGAYTRGSDVGVELKQVFTLFPRLLERRMQLSGLMSGGEQQMLAIGRALMAKPRLLLLDEPSMGLAPLVIVDIFRALRHLNLELGITILLVEQNARVALKLSQRAYVLTTGHIIRHGNARDLLADPATQEAFLGRNRARVSQQV